MHKSKRVFVCDDVVVMSDCLFTSILAAEHVEGEQHGVGEGGGLLFTGEVESVHLPRVTPLVEGGRGLVVLQALHYGIVDDHLSQRSEVSLVH